MKTTIDISDPLLAQAKKLAASRRVTLKAIIESALRDMLASQNKRAGTFRLETHTFKGQGLKPGLSWDDLDAIRSMTYEGRGG